MDSQWENVSLKKRLHLDMDYQAELNGKRGKFSC